MKHMRLIRFAVFFVLALGYCSFAFAQERTNAYYNTHETEILPDARQAFSDGRYERAIDLCEWYYIIVGDSAADELKERATACAILSREMDSFVASGLQDSAREKALAILKLNPEDARAKVASAYDSTKGEENGHEWVDLGLPSGLKWATCNIGASSPEEYGDYYAWGETSPKSEYSWRTYQFRKRGKDYEIGKLYKYNTRSRYGTVDRKTCLELSDDAAHVNWGGSWRMPTSEEFFELRQNCTFTWTSCDGQDGYKVTSKKNGSSIFLPAAGAYGKYDTRVSGTGSYGLYWSSSLFDDDNPFNAKYLSFYSAFFGTGGDGSFRKEGYPVRPVTE